MDHLFGIPHLLILAAVIMTGWGLAVFVRRKGTREKPVRIVLGVLIGSAELAWYGYVLVRGWIIPPFGLPLDLCDLILWLTVYVLLTRSARVFDVVYFWGLAGTSMALVTPDLAAPFPSLLSIKFFFSHGMVVASLLFLIWCDALRPAPRAWWKAFLWLQLYAIVIGVFNLLFRTNYFYLCSKPPGGSLLDFLGDWPLYLIVSEVLAALIFYLLGFPFRQRPAEG